MKRRAASSGVRVTTSVLVLAIVVGLVGIGVALSIRRGDRGTGGAASQDPGVPVPSRSVAAAGSLLFEYGGVPAGDDQPATGYRNDAGFFDPGTQTFEPVAEPPFDGSLTPPSAVAATADTVVLLGSLCNRPERDVESCAPATVVAAQLDVQARRWSPIEVPDELRDANEVPRRRALGVVDGSMLFALGDRGATELWRYDPAARRWSQMPAPPGRVDDLCLARSTVVAVTSPFRHRGRVIDDDPIWSDVSGGPVAYGQDDGWVNPRLMVLESGGDEWEVTQPLTEVLYPIDDDEPPTIACADAAVVVSDSRGREGGVYSLDGSSTSGVPGWRPLPAPPELGSYTQRLWDGRQVLFLNGSPSWLRTGGPMLGLDPYSLVWTPYPEGPLASEGLAIVDGDLVGSAPPSDSDGTAAELTRVVVDTDQ